MKRQCFMLVAGETSGDAMGAELVKALTRLLPHSAELPPRFIGAGGDAMAAAGVEIAFDLTKQAVTGLSDVIKKIFVFRRLLHELRDLAIREQPDAIILVDFGAFNLELAQMIKAYVRRHKTAGWQPKIIKYVSPQVWASRPGRGARMARCVDLLLCLFPFEKEWYARRLPNFRVECVGHPIFDRHGGEVVSKPTPEKPLIVLLPGSRDAELRRHLPPILEAVALIREKVPQAHFTMVLPSEKVLAQAKALGVDGTIQTQIGGLAEALSRSSLAIASTGTVTLECAYYGVPTVALYKTSWSTFQIGKRIVTVRFLAMPNLLEDDVVYPELIQDDATGGNIANESIKLLEDPVRCDAIRARLKKMMASLGGPGTANRAAEQIVKLMS